MPFDSFTIAVPSHARVLVVGGGPAGAYASAVLAQEGIDVVCCEATRFPRYHVGESLLASVKSFLKVIDAYDRINNHGFTPKPGSAFKFRPDRVEAYTDFVDVNPQNGAWNVEREDFDDLLLKHAASKGAQVFMETRISEIDMNASPYSAKWTSKTAGSGRITFDYIIDCSGREGILSTKVFRNRNHNKALKNIATWGYWTGDISLYGTGTSRESAQWLEGLATGAPGWIWFIPLRDGKVSVGVVMKESDNIALRKESTSLKEHYLRALARAPCAMKMLENGQLLDSVRTASDYSYSAESYAGDHWRMAGDAGAFIDPFFSSGVHLALNGGLSAAVSVLASIRGHVSESQAAAYHSKKSQIGYTRFLLVVLTAYKQLRCRHDDILSDVKSQNFDEAFKLLRPVIQGWGDVSALNNYDVDEKTLGKTIDFLSNVLTTSSADLMEVKKSGSIPLEVIDDVFMGPEEIARLVEETKGDEKTERALCSINARKVLHLYDPVSNFQKEEVLGMVADLSRGRVGLQTAIAV